MPTGHIRHASNVMPAALRPRSRFDLSSSYSEKLHRRTRFQKEYSREERNRGIDICRLCHDGIHDFYDEMTLAKKFTTLELIQADEKLQRHFRWVARQKGLKINGSATDKTQPSPLALIRFQSLLSQRRAEQKRRRQYGSSSVAPQGFLSATFPDCPQERQR